jgi:hypothetical protein
MKCSTEPLQETFSRQGAKSAKKIIFQFSELGVPFGFCSGHALRPFDVAQGMLCARHLFSDAAWPMFYREFQNMFG